MDAGLGNGSAGLARPLLSNASSPAPPLNLRQNSRHIILSINNNDTPALASESNQGMRWYFEQSSESGGAVSKPTVVVPPNINWKRLLKVRGITPGWYSIILGVTLSPGFTHESDTLQIEAKQLDRSRRGLYPVKRRTTVARFDEIRQIEREEFTRLMLHQQVEVETDEDIELSINTGVSLVLHYVELDVGHTEPPNVVLYGGFEPHHIIDVSYSDNDTRNRNKKIHSYALNSSGSYAATLCFTKDGQGIIELWSLVASEKRAVPIAREDKVPAKVSRPGSINISLSVSESGEYVIIHSFEPIAKPSTLTRSPGMPESPNNTMPCHISHFPPIPSSRELRLENVCKNLQGFYGHGKFHSYSLSDNQGNMNEYYIACDGFSISVYRTASAGTPWTLINTLDMTAEQNLEAASRFLTSLRSNYFAWTGNGGVVAFWDIARMKQVSYIKVASSDAEPSVSLSSDGSLAAISVKGRVSIYETFSGIHLGDYTDNQRVDKQFEVAMGLETFMAFYQDSSNDTEHRNIECKVIRIRDMKTIRTFSSSIHKDYRFDFPSPLKDQTFVYREGPVISIVKMDTDAITSCAINYREELDKVEHVLLTHNCTWEIISVPGSRFTVTASTAERRGTKLTIANITRAISAAEQQLHPSVSLSSSLLDPTTKKGTSLAIPLGPSHLNHSCMFFQVASRLVMMTDLCIQVWRLIEETESDSSEVARLELVWALREDASPRVNMISSVKASEDESQFALEFLSRPYCEELKDPANPKKNYETYEGKTLTYPYSSVDDLGISEENRISQGISNVINMYIDGDTSCQEAMIQYLKTLIRPSSYDPVNPISCISTLCDFWTYENRSFLEQIMKELLPLTKITWIPGSRTCTIHEPHDPLKKLLQTGKRQPTAIGTAKVIMDYCVSHANSSRNLSFLTPIFRSMEQVMVMFPEQAFASFKQIAYIPATERSYIIDNHKIAYPPMCRLKFWQPPSLTLPKVTDPIMQLHVSAKLRDPKNDLFTDSVFMASFDALWFYRDDTTNEESGQADLDKKSSCSKCPTEQVEPNTIVRGAPRWKSLYHMYHMFLLKLRLETRIYIKSYKFDLAFFENPAIAALVTYKWNTIGFSHWLKRFVFQCFYYILILVLAFLQVYYTGNDPTPIAEFSIAIIVMSVFFIWLEALQAYQGWEKYRKSIYNSIDMLAFLIPMAAGIHQLVVIFSDDQHGNTRLVSFSVLTVFLHMLFELRVIEMVCKYVTIIQQAIKEIQVFFGIFAAGVITFTIGILHLLHACPTSGCERVEKEGDLPINFLGALSGTYFMLGGRYEPFNSKLSSQDWPVHFMLMLFFFFTVILMLNVLIALINVAFSKGDDGWRLAWVEARMQYIETAENMSYHIPGYRKAYDCFPREIYFTATTQQVKAYQEKLDANTNKRTEKRIVMDARVERLEEQLQDLKKLLLHSTRQQRQ